MKAFACLCVLCLSFALVAFEVRADYTGGTPGGAGRVGVDPKTGDRKVEVKAPPPAAQEFPQVPVQVYPRVGRPGPRPAPSGRELAPSPGVKPPSGAGAPGRSGKSAD